MNNPDLLCLSPIEITGFILAGSHLSCAAILLAGQGRWGGSWLAILGLLAVTCLLHSQAGALESLARLKKQSHRHAILISGGK
jgi:hypothetical protein